MIKLGIVGLGTMGTLYARLAKQNPAVELRALCDLDAARLQTLGEQYPGVIPYGDLAQMFAGESLDAVCITTPDFAHLQPVLAAAAARCHILLEKPLATSVAEARQMVDAIRNAGIHCQVAYTNRWTPPYVAVKDMLAQGQLGRLVSLHSRINNTRFTPTKMLSWAARSSPAWFLMTHALDLACWFTDEHVRTVYAVGTKGFLSGLGIDVYDTIQALFTFGSGIVASIESCWILPEGMPLIFDFQYEIVGTASAAFVNTHDQMIHLATQDRLVHPKTLLMDYQGQLVGHSQQMFDSFVRAVEQNHRPLVDEMDGYYNVAAISAVHESLHTGAVVQLPGE
jgi:predicted dehydrogenase